MSSGQSRPSEPHRWHSFSSFNVEVAAIHGASSILGSSESEVSGKHHIRISFAASMCAAIEVRMFLEVAHVECSVKLRCQVSWPAFLIIFDHF